ncbi:hypothetical protein QYE76_070023 [Lolium multiflorum]|uniref:Uncharacterized protein n=1 Tax=Lolium multiflorum TaxID=4521 RepID=A0AAD8WDJ6_LOLMU|nr:hypothetical protein QYE76_070023 [Lolium multiflorum]
MAAWRHTPVNHEPGHATPSARRQAHGSQQHHDEAHGRAKSPGATAATRSPWINRLDCLNRLEEDYDNNEGAEIIGYEEPDLSGGIEGVDYLIVYGSGEASGGDQA